MPTTSGDCVANRNPQPRPEAEAQGDPAEEIEAGKRLVRIGGDRGVSLAERIASQFRLLAWKSPLHRMRLRGRFPLKLITVPTDPIYGEGAVDAAMLKGVLVTWGATGPNQALKAVTGEGSVEPA